MTMNETQKELQFFKVVLSSIADGVFTVDSNLEISGSNIYLSCCSRYPSVLPSIWN